MGAPSKTNHIENEHVETPRAQHEARQKENRAVRAIPLIRLPEPIEQPSASRPQSLLKMPDEILEFYAFLFCQRGFRELGMTFEQFLEVVDAVRPGGLCGSYA